MVSPFLYVELHSKRVGAVQLMYGFGKMVRRPVECELRRGLGCRMGPYFGAGSESECSYDRCCSWIPLTLN